MISWINALFIQVISIPVKSSGQSEERQPLQRFSFTLSNVDAVEPQGSFECIRHTKNKSIESLGKIDYKLQIHANDDSYQKTKVKMAVVERESKKNSTKVIKASDPNVGRKVKVKRQPIPSRPAPHSQSAQASQAQLSTGHNGYKSYSPPSLKLNGNTINGIPNDKTSVSNNSISSSKSNYLNANLDTNQNGVKKSLREVIVHLLAMRPLKKSELLERLYLDNIAFDKKELTLVLNNISDFKDNVYELSKTGWSDVQTDWSDYTSEERESVRRRNPLLSTCSTQPSQQSLSLPTTARAKSPLSDCGSMRSVDSPMSVANSPLGSKSPAIKRTTESAPPTAKKHKSLGSCANPSNDKCESTKLKTNGYNHLLNGWANKPSSPDREPSVANLMNANVSANSTLNPELKGSDSLSATSQSSPDFNPLYLSQPQQFHNQTNSGVTYLANDNSFKKTQSRHSFKRYKQNYRTTNGNGSDSINSSPNSSPDSGTGSHDGSTLSSSNSYSCTNDDNPDYLS